MLFTHPNNLRGAFLETDVMVVSGLDDRPDDRHRRCRLNCCQVDGTEGGAREGLKEAKACRKHGNLLVSE